MARFAGFQNKMQLQLWKKQNEVITRCLWIQGLELGDRYDSLRFDQAGAAIVRSNEVLWWSVLQTVAKLGVHILRVCPRDPAAALLSSTV